jgi:hypothetical protein
MFRCHRVLLVLTDSSIIDAATDNCCDYQHYAVQFCATCTGVAVFRNALTFKMNIGTRNALRCHYGTFTVQIFGNNSDKQCDEGRRGNSGLTRKISFVKLWNEA